MLRPVVRLDHSIFCHRDNGIYEQVKAMINEVAPHEPRALKHRVFLEIRVMGRSGPVSCTIPRGLYLYGVGYEAHGFLLRLALTKFIWYLMFTGCIQMMLDWFLLVHLTVGLK